MKKTAPLLAAVLLCALLGGCSFTPAPEKALDAMLGKLSSGKIRAAEAYTLEGTLNINRSSRSAEKIYSPLFGSMTYTVTGSERDGESAVVSVSIEIVDMETLMEEVSVQAVQSIFTASGDRFYQLLLERLQAEDAPMASFSVSVNMVRVNGRWKVDMAKSGKFANAITGGVRALIGY